MELHFLSDEQKIKRLDTALDRAIEILQVQGDCPVAHPEAGDCISPSKFKTCEPSEDGYECWRRYLTRWSE